MVTNGTCLDAATVRALRDAGISRIAVSLDGLEATHDRIRGQAGLFRRIVDGIGRLENAGIPVSVITTFNAWNIGERRSLGSLLASIGVSDWQVQPVCPLGRAGSLPSFAITDDAYRELGRFLRDEAPRFGREGLMIQPADSFGYYAPWDTRSPPWKGCNAGIISCGIMSDGRVKGCLSLPDTFVEGDLRARDLWDIWFDDASFSYTRHRGREKAGPNCAACPKWEACGGGCTAMSAGTTGQPGNDPYCFFRLGEPSG